MTKAKNAKPMNVLVMTLALLGHIVSSSQTSDQVKIEEVYSSTTLDLQNPQNCAGVHEGIVDFKSFWHSSYFETMIKESNPNELKDKLAVRLNSAAQINIKFVTDYYTKMNEKILDQYNQQKELIFTRIKEDYTLLFINSYVTVVKKKECTQDSLKELQLYYNKVDMVGGLDYMADRLINRNYEMQFFIEYYLFTDPTCKSAVIEPLVKFLKNPKAIQSGIFKDTLDDKMTLFVNKKGNPENKGDINYPNFIDYTTINPPAIVGSDVLLVYKKLLPLNLFTSIFLHYKETEFVLFEIIYEIINTFRLNYKGNTSIVLDEGKVMIEFKEYLDSVQINHDGAYYIIIIVLLSHSHPSVGVFKTFKTPLKHSDEILLTFVNSYPEFKKPLKDLATANKIVVDVNQIKRKHKSKKGFKQIMEEDIISTTASFGEPVEELRDYIAELKGSKVSGDQETLAGIEADFYGAILIYFKDRKEIDPQVLIRYTIIIQKVGFVLDIYNVRSIEKMIIAIDDKDGSYLISFRRMVQFFQNKEAQTKVKAFDKSIKDTPALRLVCDEIDMDFKIYGGVTTNMCSNISPQRPKFEDKFLENFLKMLSFVRMFRFYNNANPMMVSFYTRIYKYAALNKYSFNIDNKINDIVLRFNDMLAKYANRADFTGGLKELTDDILDLHDLLKLLNIANLNLDNPEIISTVTFETIYFARLNYLLTFYEKVDKKDFDPFLAFAYGHYEKLPHHYHFNNIYMLLKIHGMVLTQGSTATPDKSSTDILALIKTVNTMTDTNGDAELLVNIKVTRRAAFFFYIYYMNKVKEEGKVFFPHLSKVLKEDIKDLEQILQIKLIQQYIIPGIAFNPVSKNNFKSGANKNFRRLVVHGVERLKKAELQSQELYTYLATDYFKIMNTEGKDIELEKSGVLPVLIDRIFQIYQNNKASRYQNEIERIGDVSKDFFAKRELITVNDVLLINYYYAISFLRNYNLDGKAKDTFQTLSQHMNVFYNAKVTEYVAKTSKPEVDSRGLFGFNADYLLFSSLLLFNKVYPTQQFTVPALGTRKNLNYMFGLVLLENWPEGIKFYRGEKRLTPIMIDVTKITTTYSKLLKLNEIKQYKTLANLNNNLFGPVCLSNVFSFVMRNDVINEDLDMLKSAVNSCMHETNKNVLLQIIFRLLKNVQFISDGKTETHRGSEVRPIFNIILDKARATFDSKEILYLMKGLVASKRMIHFHKDFSKTLAALTRKYSLDELNQKIDDFAKIVPMDAISLGRIKSQLVKDIILVYNDEEEEDDNFDLGHIDLSKLDLFSILSERSRFAYFLTKIFADVDIKAKDSSVLDTYMTLYLFVANFRVKFLGNYDLPSSFDENEVTEFDKKFADYINNELNIIKDKSMRTIVYYLKLVNFMMNQKNLQNKSKLSAQCAIFKDIIEVIIKSPLDTLNGNQIKLLISNNKMALNNSKYLYAKAKYYADKFNSHDTKNPCETIKAAPYKSTLEEWTYFYFDLFKNEPKVNTFIQPKNQKMLDFDIRTIIKHQLLLI